MASTSDSTIIIKHCLAGRVRLSVPWLKKNKIGLSQVLDGLNHIPGVTKAGGSSATGSVLVYFEEGRLAPAEVINFVEEARTGPAGGMLLPVAEKNTSAKTGGVQEPEDLPLPRQALNVALGGGVLGFLALKQALVGKSTLARSEKLFNIAAAAAVISGYPVFKSGVENLLTRGRLNYDLVMGALSLGTILMRESVPGLLVVWLVNLNALIQSLVLAQSQKAAAGFAAAGDPAGRERLEKTSVREVRQKPGAGKAPAEEHAEKIIPVSLGLAAVSAVTTRNFNTALAALLAGSPAPAGLARPGALAAATALALKKGISVRSPAAFARLQEADSIVFTGGGLPGCRPEMAEALPLPGFSRLDLVSLARDAVQHIHTENPEHYHEGIYDSHAFGMPVSAGGRSILIGGKEFMSQSGINTDPAFLKEKRLRLNRMFPLYLACDGALAGVLGFRQHISGDTMTTMENIRSRGATGTYLAVDEGNQAAFSLATELGLKITPSSRAAHFIHELQRGGSTVAAVGYGRGDQDQFGAADIKITFKQPPGSLFLGEADIILENFSLLSDAFALSFMAREKEIQNVELTGVLNTLGLLLAVSRLLSPIGASVFNNLIGAAVSLNSLSMLYRQLHPPTAANS